MEEKKEAYSDITEGMSENTKLDILEQLGRTDLIQLFKDWKPRPSKSKTRTAPLDQRVTVVVTEIERKSLLEELEEIKLTGTSVSMAQFMRNRAMANIDIHEWKRIAEEALTNIEKVKLDEKDLRKRKKQLTNLIDSLPYNEDDAYILYQREVKEINEKLNMITAQSVKRTQRLSGRLTMAESEQIKWRAQRLCLSTSDYLRFLIFAQMPNSLADSHMSLDAKRRFYISIIDVAKNGWGSPPTLYECNQCKHYLDELNRTQEQLDQLKRFMNV